MVAVLIPAYEPDSKLISLVQRLKKSEFEIVVVDDGSGADYADIFSAVKEYAHVLVHECNRGKGAALKTGMVYIRDHMPQAESFITCDADGQHRVEDVIRVRSRLLAGQKFVLTMRTPNEDVPLRSKVGNTLSRVVYTLLTKRYLADNQSGLRGFSCTYIDWMAQVKKDNYDYEMNVLYYAAKKGIYISTLMIDAIYIDNNQSSHFHPIKDTARIYYSLFSLAVGLFVGHLAAELLVALASVLFGYQHLMVSVPGAGAVAYFVSVFVSQFLVFRNSPCYDYISQLIHQVIAYFLYTLGCLLFSYACPQVPLWVAFNLVFLLALPLRYWLHKFTFIAMRTRDEVLQG